MPEPVLLPMPNDRARLAASILRGVMLTAATGAGARYVAWNQYTMGVSEHYDGWLGGGLCRGLSIKFLVVKRDGGNFATSVNGNNRQVDDQYARSALNTEIEAAALPGNASARGEGEPQLHAFLRARYQFEHVTSETFGKVSRIRSHTRFGSFIGQSEYYYLVSIPGHSMACAAIKGHKVFFDPNAGIAVCDNSSQLESFCTRYFGHEEITRRYGRGSKVELLARRYRSLV